LGDDGAINAKPKGVGEGVDATHIKTFRELCNDTNLQRLLNMDASKLAFIVGLMVRKLLSLGKRLIRLTVIEVTKPHLRY